MMRSTEFPMLVCLSIVLSCAVTSCKKQNAAPKETNESANKFEQDRTDAEAVMADLMKAWDNVETIRASVSFEMQQGAGGPGLTRGKGNYLFRKSRGKAMLRYFTENNIIMKKDPRDPDGFFTIEHVEWACDGDFLFKRTLQHKLHTMTRDVYRPEDVLQIGGPELLDAIRREPRVFVVGSTVIQGKPAVVIGTSDEKGGWATEHTFDTESGVRVLWVGKNEVGEETLRMTVSDIILNVEWVDGEFVMQTRSDIVFTDLVPKGSQP